MKSITIIAILIVLTITLFSSKNYIDIVSKTDKSHTWGLYKNFWCHLKGDNPKKILEIRLSKNDNYISKDSFIEYMDICSNDEKLFSNENYNKFVGRVLVRKK